MRAAQTRLTTYDVPTLVNLEGPVTRARTEAEAFVADAFADAYDARIDHFMPALLTLRNDAGALLAVLGLRRPDVDPLFLECYLDEPVEACLQRHTDQPVSRKDLVEVGNFAVGAAGGGRWLITALTAYLYSAQLRWAVFTCGPRLQNAFRRLGVELVDLAPADPLCLAPAERSAWGSYYAQQPRVMAANVAQSHGVLARLFESECALHGLWNGALQAGLLAA